VERKYPTIKQLIKNPSFDPHTQQGAIAHEWREFLVQDLFRGTNLTPNEKVEQLKAMKASIDNDVSTSEQGLGSSHIFMPAPQRIVHPRGFESQLPPFTLPYRKVTNTPETKPTLAYVVVGPRIRGKFDAAKAKELRIPKGRQRTELTKGQAITFMVSDEQGGRGMIEKIVQPEEVVGPSECPSVSTAY
jgi:ribonuclease Z